MDWHILVSARFLLQQSSKQKYQVVCTCCSYGSLGVGREQKFEKHKREMFAWFSGAHTHTLPDSFLKLALLRTFLAKTCNSELFCCVRNLVRAHIMLDELLSCSFASPNTCQGSVPSCVQTNGLLHLDDI